MDAIHVKNFRCFADSGLISLRPLTILVGENSSGKSSFLASIRLGWDLSHGGRVDFNSEPFLLGAFDQIAHFRGGRGGRASTFEISIHEEPRMRRATGTPTPSKVQVGAEFAQSGSHPVVISQYLEAGPYRVVARFGKDLESPEIEFYVDGELRRTVAVAGHWRVRPSPDSAIDWRLIQFMLDQPVSDQDTVSTGSLSKQEWEYITSMMRAANLLGSSRPIATAPVRTRPSRTYNPVSDTPLPEGEHVPMVLAKTFFEKKQDWARLKESLDKFGKASGLFSSLDIKGLGRHESDPFQIRVKIKGPPSNLIDVGYGVSQVLPIVVDAIRATRNDLYLLQQPEVHLHPKAQAELGSFLAELSAAQSKRFVVETHSDYLIDRLRMDVRDKKRVKPSDISLLYFERRGVEVAIRPLEIDAQGNIVNAPKSYRRFFLDEERRLLGL